MHRYIFIQVGIITLFLSSLLLGQENDFPYELKKADFGIIASGASAKLYANYREANQKNMSYDELISLDKNDINLFDLSATNNWNENLDGLSDWTRNILIAAPSAIVLHKAINKEWKNGFTYGIMYFEVALVTVGFTDLTKTIVMRKRPYLYNTDISLAEREEKIATSNVFDSFYSGHTAAAFASAVFLSKTISDIYGKTTLSKIIWTSSLTIASTTGYLRYKSGHHYPTDVLVGVAVGSAIGYFIPQLHKKSLLNENVNVILSGNSLKLCYNF